MTIDATQAHWFNGNHLFGDDMSPAELARWYEFEKEGYAQIVADRNKPYEYAYHALNTVHGYNHIGNGTLDHVLGLGSAYGEEFKPVIQRINRLTIVEPSDTLVSGQLEGKPITYVKPQVSGELPFPDKTFDLVTAFGVLHHIPNVSFVMKEICRTLKPGGHFLTREPIVSMGNFLKPRPGLTMHERGIPIPYFRKSIAGAGMTIVRESLIGFPITMWLFRKLRMPTNNTPIATRIDSMVSRMFAWNWTYHSDAFVRKFRPTNVYFVLRRDV
jgi:SAM-dependent methyltransferase